ncbi:MAG: glycosyltransferase family 2 protein [Burkholderiales bacterium]
MLNIVVPMAGAGSRFAREGYIDPKPLIPVQGVPMIRLVIENLRPKCAHRFIFICQVAHVAEYDLTAKLQAWAGAAASAAPAIVIGIDGLTEGAACTVLKAKELINNTDPLMIANSDQWCDIDINAYLDRITLSGLDGLIMTMKASDPKWSFVGLDDQELVTRVVEKEVISDEATVGIYNYSRGADFIQAAEAMIAANERVNNEFYVAPAYNSLIANGAKVGVYNIGSEAAGMYGLGIPNDLKLFTSLPIHNKALEPCL